MLAYKDTIAPVHQTLSNMWPQCHRKFGSWIKANDFKYLRRLWKIYMLDHFWYSIRQGQKIKFVQKKHSHVTSFHLLDSAEWKHVNKNHGSGDAPFSEGSLLVSFKTWVPNQDLYNFFCQQTAHVRAVDDAGFYQNIGQEGIPPFSPTSTQSMHRWSISFHGRDFKDCWWVCWFVYSQVLLDFEVVIAWGGSNHFHSRPLWVILLGS